MYLSLLLLSNFLYYLYASYFILRYISTYLICWRYWCHIWFFNHVPSVSISEHICSLDPFIYILFIVSILSTLTIIYSLNTKHFKNFYSFIKLKSLKYNFESKCLNRNVYYHDKRDNWPKTNGQMAKIKLTYEQNCPKRNDYFHTLQN